MTRETNSKVGGEKEEPAKEPTMTSEEPMEHDGWCKRRIWSDELAQDEAELDKESNWCEVKGWG